MKYVFFILAAAQILMLFASIVAIMMFAIRRVFRAYINLGNAQAAQRAPAARNNQREAHHAPRPVAVPNRL